MIATPTVIATPMPDPAASAPPSYPKSKRPRKPAPSALPPLPGEDPPVRLPPSGL
jgi:hypothetical protein